jgi:hypothetical protein
MFARKLGGIGLTAHNCPYTLHFVRADRDADSGPAKYQSFLAFSAGYRLADSKTKVAIVNSFQPISSKVLNLIAFRDQIFLNFLFERKCCVI